MFNTLDKLEIKVVLIKKIFSPLLNFLILMPVAHVKPSIHRGRKRRHVVTACNVNMVTAYNVNVVTACKMNVVTAYMNMVTV